MNLAHLAKAAVVAFALPASAMAVTADYDVNAQGNSSGTGGTGLATVSLVLGQEFSVSVDPGDFWKNGGGPGQERNADGIRTLNGTTNSVTVDGFTSNVGSLVGRIEAGGSYFTIGTSFTGLADATGILKLFFWDTDSANNEGFVTASITTAAVPLPASLGFLAAGLAGLGLVRRKKA